MSLLHRLRFATYFLAVGVFCAVTLNAKHSHSTDLLKDLTCSEDASTSYGYKPDCKETNSDIYDIWINLYEIDGLKISEISSDILDNSTRTQKIIGKQGDLIVYGDFQKSPSDSAGWDQSVVTKSAIKSRTKKFETNVDIVSIEYFYHRRAVLEILSLKGQNGLCARAHRIKDTHYYIQITFCGENIENRIHNISNTIKNYMQHKIKLSTRAENKAAYDNANRTTSASTSSSSSNTIKSVADKSEKGLCNYALTSANKDVMWDTGSAYTKYVDEAKRRGYTPASCAKALGGTATVAKSTSSQSNTSDQSFKRKMCESSKTSSKVQASFMQSLSENELTKFLETGQDCSVF